jgi:exonuclease VII large subunit
VKALVAKKHDLRRGFADLNTPSEAEKELVYNWQELKTDLNYQIKKLNKQIEAEIDPKKRNALICHRNGKVERRTALGRKIQKRVDLSLLVIDRLKQIVSKEDFEKACFLAREDKARILTKIPIED